MESGMLNGLITSTQAKADENGTTTSLDFLLVLVE
jgi:hypothetical protein